MGYCSGTGYCVQKTKGKLTIIAANLTEQGFKKVGRFITKHLEWAHWNQKGLNSIIHLVISITVKGIASFWNYNKIRDSTDNLSLVMYPFEGTCLTHGYTSGLMKYDMRRHFYQRSTFFKTERQSG